MQFTALAIGEQSLLRSESAVTIERSKSQMVLFDPVKYLQTPVIMLVHRFHRHGLDLSVAGTCEPHGRQRLEATGSPTFVATWPYVPDYVALIDQRMADPFMDLDELDGWDEGASE